MENITTTPNYQVKTKTSTVTRFLLEGTTSLKVEKVTTTYEVKLQLPSKPHKPSKIISKAVIAEVIEPLFSFSLTEITAKELAAYRRSGKPGFVLKYGGNLYYTSVPKKLNFVSSTILGEHRCAECHHLSAASDEAGGCAKVRDYSKNIERYSWITTGYETFNTNHNVFVVVNCQHYEEFPPQKKLSIKETNRLRLGLAQFMWEWVESLEEVRALKKKNFGIIENIPEEEGEEEDDDDKEGAVQN